MNHSTRFAALLLSAFFGVSYGATAQARDSLKAYDHWRALRVGLFVHWGPSSGRALPESHSHARKSALNPHGSVPAEVYDQFYKTFNPVQYDPDAWLKLAYAAGIRYAVFVAKHHDGFCMFQTDANDYSIMATPYGKDVASMFAAACKRQGLALGWQISPKDWKHPDYHTANQDRYNAWYLRLIDDLTKNYGPVSVLWFDGIEPVGLDQWKSVSQDLPALVYARHPNLMLGVHGAVKEDFLSFETMVGPFDRTKPWETCEPINPSGWVYNKPMPSYPFRDLLRNLVYTVARDGNYLLDVGPMENGQLYPPDAQRLQEFGKWMRTHAEGIHGTRGGPYRDGAWGGATCKGNFIYLYVSDAVGSTLVLPKLPAKILAVKYLDGGHVRWKEQGGSWVIALPRRHKKTKPIFTCVRLELDQPAFSLPIVEVQTNLAASADLTISSIRDDDGRGNGPYRLFDNDGVTAWQTASRDTLASLEFDLHKPTAVASLSLSERGQTEGWNHWFQLKLQVRNGAQEPWRTVLTHAGTLGGPPILSFDPQIARFVKLEIANKAGVQLQVAELRLMGPL